MLHLMRVETVAKDGSSGFNKQGIVFLTSVDATRIARSHVVLAVSEIQTTEIVQGSVPEKLAVPLYLVLPRLFTCPTTHSPTFKIEFAVDLEVILKGIPDEPSIEQGKSCERANVGVPHRGPCATQGIPFAGGAEVGEHEMHVCESERSILMLFLLACLPLASCPIECGIETARAFPRPPRLDSESAPAFPGKIEYRGEPMESPVNVIPAEPPSWPCCPVEPVWAKVPSGRFRRSFASSEARVPPPRKMEALLLSPRVRPVCGH